MRCPPRPTVQARRRFRNQPVAATVVVVSVIKEWVMSKSLLVRIAFCASIFVLLVGIVGLALWLGAALPMNGLSGGVRLTNGLMWLASFFALCLLVAQIASWFRGKRRSEPLEDRQCGE